MKIFYLNLKLLLLLMFSVISLNINAASSEDDIPYVSYGGNLVIEKDGYTIKFSPNEGYEYSYSPDIISVTPSENCSESLTLPNEILCNVEVIVGFEEIYDAWDIYHIPIFEPKLKTIKVHTIC